MTTVLNEVGHVVDYSEGNFKVNCEIMVDHMVTATPCKTQLNNKRKMKNTVEILLTCTFLQDGCPVAPDPLPAEDVPGLAVRLKVAQPDARRLGIVILRLHPKEMKIQYDTFIG